MALHEILHVKPGMALPRAPWTAQLGARSTPDGVEFCVWAPAARYVDVVVERSGDELGTYSLCAKADGYFHGRVFNAKPGDRYRYVLDRGAAYPDPASRFQPLGVHGPSEVIDPSLFHWTDEGWRGISIEEAVIYELHVGTFSPQGTFAGVTAQLPYLKDLGVTAIELMPIADFPGDRNWGYDGVSLFAPARCYGRPDDLRTLVDAAHRLNLAVILDVVYNHLGPDGNYLGVFSPDYFTDRHRNAWGAAIDFDGRNSGPVRQFFVQNALHWIHEYHIDGVRLDATHAIFDDSPRHILAELADEVHRAVPGKSMLVIAEDHRNLAHMLQPESEGGWGLDATWADGFHHQMRRLLAGDSEGYYRDYSGTTDDLATTIRKGWFICGQHSQHLGEPRGTDPSGLPPRSFVVCLQNHDQIGNRALGERLNHEIDLAAYRAASVLLLCSPATPLLFMGQEWGASAPFLYFTDHEPQLGKLVTEGRRREFQAFSAFADSRLRIVIPDPQAPATFTESRLSWEELSQQQGNGLFRLYRTLLRLRQTEPSLKSARRDTFSVAAVGDGTIVLERWADGAPRLAVIVCLIGSQTVEIGTCLPNFPTGRCRTLLTTEDEEFTPHPHHIDVNLATARIRFTGPGAVVLASR